jgi:thymidylate kinase
MRPAGSGAHAALTVSFSGIDGAGKSTQIASLQTWLHELGFQAKLLTFWDDVAVFSAFRESLSHRAFKGDRGVGSPERPLQRRDKNVNAWAVTLVRLFFYFADALHLRQCVKRARKAGAQVVIFDRYIYDELANLPLSAAPFRAFVRLILKIVPQPDLALVIDADPHAAYARKPEYPLEFVRRNREAYRTLAQLAGNIRIIPPSSIASMCAQIRQEMIQVFNPRNTVLSADAANGRPANISQRELIEH